MGSDGRLSWLSGSGILAESDRYGKTFGERTVFVIGAKGSFLSAGSYGAFGFRLKRRALP